MTCITTDRTALGIAQDVDGNGLDPLTHRKLIQAKWENPGIVWGLDVSASKTGGLKYDVSEGVAVVCRSEADGYAEAYFGGGTIELDPADASLGRLDVIWIRAHDASQGDVDNRIEVGCTAGTPKSGAPDVPTLPTGAEIVRFVYVDAGQVAADDANLVDGQRVASLRNVSRGDDGSGQWLNHSNGRKVNIGEAWTFATREVSVGTAYREYLALMAVSVWASDCQTKEWLGSGYVDLLVDGKVEQTFRFTCSPYVTETKGFFWTIGLRKGKHTIAARLWGSGTDVISSVTTQYQDGYFPGCYMRLIDLGANG